MATEECKILELYVLIVMEQPQCEIKLIWRFWKYEVDHLCRMDMGRTMAESACPKHDL